VIHPEHGSEPFVGPATRPEILPRREAPLLDALNPAQREAVSHDSGPLLVLAGAGSGKTRVITHRIAHLVTERGVDPGRLVAVTFTNKAAGEMRERVDRLVGPMRLGGAWIGTFHALCLRILRRDGAGIGLASGFNIYDTSDQLSVVRQILREQGADDASGTARPILARISRAKNALESPDDMLGKAFTPEAQRAARVYAAYQDTLRRANAVDFDDLLVRTLDLFRERPEVAERYADRCLHLLVDEYQDTNRPQYLLVRALSAKHGNVCVVGDEDQSIYRFRGAEIRNILEFEHDHPGARVIKLEQNYRSTSVILDAAGAVIAHNEVRKGKTLWTELSGGDKIELHHALTDRTEAERVARSVARLSSSGVPYEQMAVLYRTNAQSRQFEEIFRRDQIPYQVVGSVQFYDRKEVKDLLAYLKLVANPGDEISFRRIVNVPPRGIGATTVHAIDEVALASGISLLEGARRLVAQQLVPARSARMVAAFLDLMDALSRERNDLPVAALLERVVREVDYEGYLEKTFPGEGLERMDNVKALITAAVEYHEEAEEPTLLGFLDRSALVSDADEVGARPGVTLMTIHCAKGLEFDSVFLAGLEESLFPHARSLGSHDDMEEERRLCYVALTRAKRRLFLSHAGLRRVQGLPVENPPSRFVSEIPVDLIDEIRPDPSELRLDLGAWEATAPYRGSSAARAAGSRGRARGTSRRPRLQADPGDGFPVGASVTHPLFGSGFITERAGSGPSLKLTIDFAEHGSKKILPAYTKLRVYT
jgi:DNA helicase-2/ATP-dependent DNA helicase PcrA